MLSVNTSSSCPGDLLPLDHAPYLKYYNRLNLEEQRKFLFRTYLFRKAKRFHYIEVNESAEMPILISATRYSSLSSISICLKLF